MIRDLINRRKKDKEELKKTRKRILKILSSRNMFEDADKLIKLLKKEMEYYEKMGMFMNELLVEAEILLIRWFKWHYEERKKSLDDIPLNKHPWESMTRLAQTSTTALRDVRGKRGEK